MYYSWTENAAIIRSYFKFASKIRKNILQFIKASCNAYQRKWINLVFCNPAFIILFNSKQTIFV